MSRKYAERSRTINKLLLANNLASDDIVFDSAAHDEVNLSLKYHAECSTSFQEGMEPLGDFYRAESYKKINVAVSMPEVFPESTTKDE